MVRAPTSTPHPAADLLHSYATDGFPASIDPPWPMSSILAGIATGPHKSTQTKHSAQLFRNELLDRVKRGFSIILSKDDAIKYPGTRLRISRLTSVDQANIKPRLICNSPAAPNNITPSANFSSNATQNSDAIQSGS